MNKQDPIIIVGAGIFGLSTALHLASSGYSDVTVFDRHPVDKTRYSYFEGCDGASAGKVREILKYFPVWLSWGCSLMQRTHQPRL